MRLVSRRASTWRLFVIVEDVFVDDMLDELVDDGEVDDDGDVEDGDVEDGEVDDGDELDGYCELLELEDGFDCEFWSDEEVCANAPQHMPAAQSSVMNLVP